MFERAEKPGGLLRFGIPEFKMEKAVLDRRLDQMEAEGVEFRCGVSVGEPAPEVDGAAAAGVTVVSAGSLVDEFDAVLLAGGATLPRDLPVPGRQLAGIHRAMDFLKPSNLVREGLLAESPISAEGKHVVIIGGGDTGADCLGTVHRQRALSVHQLEIMPEPPDQPDRGQPVADLAADPADLVGPRGGGRAALLGDHRRVPGRRERPGAGPAGVTRSSWPTRTTAGPTFVPVEGSEFELPCELVLLAMGFLGAETTGCVADLGRRGRRAGAAWPPTTRGRPTWTACSCAAT